ncbi:MAG: glycosyltransferase family 4 protein [Pseudohongiellaceae bacterium]
MNEQPSVSTAANTSASQAAIPLSAAELRVAVVSDALKDRNGVDTYYRDLVTHLRRHVADIRYMSPNPEDGELYTRFRFPLPGDATQQVVFPHATSLYAELKALRPHVIVAATNGPFGMLALYAARRLDAQLVAGFHTLIEDLCNMYWGRVLGGVTRGYMEFQNWLLFRYSARVVVNSQSMIESAHNLSSTPVTLMGTPLDESFLSKPVQEPTASLHRILYAGRLAPEKNLEALIDCARTHTHLQFTIAGAGPLRQEVETQSAALPNLNYVGHLPRQRIVDAIDEHDLLVLPSHLEAFGTIALEAMVRKRLVLVSSHCGILSWESLVHGLYQYPPEESLAEAVARIEALDPAERAATCETARRTALEIHDTAISGWLDLFVRLTSER